MYQSLYTIQSRRCAKILKHKFNLTLLHTSYHSWEYSLPNSNGLTVEVCYSQGWDIKRFKVIDYNKIIYSTDSFKEFYRYLFFRSVQPDNTSANTPPPSMSTEECGY